MQTHCRRVEQLHHPQSRDSCPPRRHSPLNTSKVQRLDLVLSLVCLSFPSLTYPPRPEIMKENVRFAIAVVWAALHQVQTGYHISALNGISAAILCQAPIDESPWRMLPSWMLPYVGTLQSCVPMKVSARRKFNRHRTYEDEGRVLRSASDALRNDRGEITRLSSLNACWRRFNCDGKVEARCGLSKLHVHHSETHRCRYEIYLFTRLTPSHLDSALSSPSSPRDHCSDPSCQVRSPHW